MKPTEISEPQKHRADAGELRLTRQHADEQAHGEADAAEARRPEHVAEVRFDGSRDQPLATTSAVMPKIPSGLPSTRPAASPARAETGFPFEAMSDAGIGEGEERQGSATA
jgi:hypothetical protein